MKMNRTTVGGSFERRVLAPAGLLGACLVAAGSFFAAAPVSAQDSTTAATGVLTTEGIAGEVDKHRRGPQLSVNPVRDGEVVKLLVAAASPNSQFTKYPIRYDFFINRRLFSSQITAPELPGAVGVDIGKDVAAPPFNYSVMATVLHPNRQYTSVVYGAVYGQNLSGNFVCDATVDGDVLDQGAVVVTQQSEVALQFSFTATGTSVSDAGVSTEIKKELAGTVTIGAEITSEGQADTTGTVIVDKSAIAETVSGEATILNGTLNRFDVATVDAETLAISCVRDGVLVTEAAVQEENLQAEAGQDGAALAAAVK